MQAGRRACGGTDGRAGTPHQNPTLTAKDFGEQAGQRANARAGSRESSNLAGVGVPPGAQASRPVGRRARIRAASPPTGSGQAGRQAGQQAGRPDVARRRKNPGKGGREARRQAGERQGGEDTEVRVDAHTSTYGHTHAKQDSSRRRAGSRVGLPHRAMLALSVRDGAHAARRDNASRARPRANARMSTRQTACTCESHKSVGLLLQSTSTNAQCEPGKQIHDSNRHLHAHDV